MSTQTQVPASTVKPSMALGANTMALAGLGLVGYGIMFLIRNFNGFIELGLTPEHIGASEEEIQAFSPDLYHYISHIQVAAAGFIIAIGVAVIALAWFGIRRGERWALWTALIVPMIAIAIGIPLHYPFGFATLGHLGLVYLDVAILLVGTFLSYRSMNT